nr:STT3 domain-containing protein [Candidatus Njordarchaeum guaymaensis]
RLSPIFTYEPLLKEFDPWYFYRSVQYIVQNGFGPWFTWTDYLAWTPFGRNVATSTYPGMIFAAVFIYDALNLAGIQVSAFTVCYYFPVIFGALTPIITYFLGKEAYDRRSGLLAAFFIAVSPAIIQRQVAGFFDNEAFGIFLMLCTFYFYLRALKRDSVPSAIMAGLFLGFVCISWGILRYVIDILALFIFVMLVLRRYTIKLFNASVITLLLGLFIATLAPRNGARMLTGGDVLPAIFILGLLIAYEGSKYFARIPFFSKIGKKAGTVNPFLLFAIGGVGVLVILLLTPMGSKFFTVLLPIFRETQARILASVGEHLPTVWASFYWYLGITVALSIVGLYFSFRRLSDMDVFMILSTVTLVYFSGSMIRIVVTLSPILAIVAGYGLSSTLRPFSKIMLAPKEEVVHRKRLRLTPAVGREYSAVAFLMVGLILFAYGTTIVAEVPGSQVTLIQSMSPPEILPGGVYHDWQEALAWMNNVAPSNSVVASWWDYGYFITCVGNRTSVDDNGTINSTQIALIGLAFMSTNETASLQIFRRFNTRYVLTYFGHMQSGLAGDEGKWLWMLRIAADNFASQGLINETLYFNETAQLIHPLFFNTTLYRLMYNGEPYQTGLPYQASLDDVLVLNMGTSNSTRRMAYQPFPAVNPNQNALSTMNNYFPQSQQGYVPVSVIDPYGPRFFKTAFVSSNHLVKIYEVDYTPLEMNEKLSIDVNATRLYNNGTAVVTVKNNGGASFPPIPLNNFVDATGRTHNGGIWLNNSRHVATQPLQVWDAGSSSWSTHYETYYVNPGQSITFRVSGLDTTMLTQAFTNGTKLNLRVVTAYDEGVYAVAEVSVISP